jgi:Fe-S cluster assembly ATP-binding protein
MHILKIEDFTLTLGDTKIINNLNADFLHGHVHAVVGPNGAGKTSLASTVMGLDGYTEFTGKIIFDGEDISNLKTFERARKGITLGWQEPARYEGLTVYDFISASAGVADQDKIEDVLRKMGLSPDVYMHRALDETLSGGERKKIELASILAMDVKLVLLDEPDSGIDIESLERIFDAIKIMKDRGVTIILITHSLSVLKQADNAFLICHGEIVEQGEASKIIPYFESRCIPCPRAKQASKDTKENKETVKDK